MATDGTLRAHALGCMEEEENEEENAEEEHQDRRSTLYACAASYVVAAVAALAFPVLFGLRAFAEFAWQTEPPQCFPSGR